MLVVLTLQLAEHRIAVLALGIRGRASESRTVVSTAAAARVCAEGV